MRNTVNMRLLLAICAIFFTTICTVKCARILGISHMPTYSHFQLGDRIYKELAARGHEVTVISPFELKAPVKNLRHIVLTGMLETIEKNMQHNLFEIDQNILSNIVVVDKFGYLLTEAVLNHTNVQKLLKSNENFDLVIYELFLNDAFVGFPNHYKAPSIIISSIGVSQWSTGMMGNPHNPAYLPEFALNCPREMNLAQRILNTLVYLGTELYRYFHSQPNQNYLLQKYFAGAPSVTELFYNTSLMLLNSHVSMHNPLPLVSNMVEIGGYHIPPTKALPKDLQDYLDDSKGGAILFSMGSNLKSKDMPVHQRDAILKVLGKLKQNVLWKWEDDILPGQPPNVKLMKWLPQQDILAHPNIKLFITHGGMLSTIEAIYFGVPVLGLPVYGDQQQNMANAESAGYGIAVSFKNLNEATLSAALTELLNNPKYTENVKKRSVILHDQLGEPLERGIHWIEYVLRHKGAPHLRSAALNLHWYQYMLLDVAAVLLVCVITFCYILSKAVKLVCRRKRQNINKDKKKN